VASGLTPLAGGRPLDATFGVVPTRAHHLRAGDFALAARVHRSIAAQTCPLRVWNGIFAAGDRRAKRGLHGSPKRFHVLYSLKRISLQLE
jgi:hypothetical protein